MKREIFLNKYKLLSPFIIVFFILCASFSNLYAGDVIEIVYPWEKPSTEIEQKVYECLIKELGSELGEFYYHIFKQCKKDILFNKEGKLKLQTELEYYKNGEKISEQDYEPLVLSKELSKYETILYQKDAGGNLLKIGQARGGSPIKPAVHATPALISKLPPRDSFFTSPYSLGGMAALVLGLIFAGLKEEEEQPPPSSPPGYQPNPPAAPSNLVAEGVSSYQINLNWIVESINELGFKIERKQGPTGVWTQIAQIPQPGVSFYADTTVLPNTLYYYRVRAYNADGNSPYSNEASATTPQTLPIEPSGLTATAVSSQQINLRWNDNSINEDGFEIWYWTSWPLTSTIWVGANQGTGIMFYEHYPLSPTTTYYYQIRAYNTAGSSGWCGPVSATTFAPPGTAPTSPTGLTLVWVTSSSIKFQWNDNSNNELGFKIYRSITDSSNYTLRDIVGANVTVYLDTPLSPTTTYYYKISAYNDIGENWCENPSEISATTSAPAVVPPAAPTGLTATAISETWITLTWTDNADNEELFKIERRANYEASFQEIATVGLSSGVGNLVTYTDTSLFPYIRYYYRVRAWNSAGYSDYSNVISATTLGPPNPLIASSQPKFQYNIFNQGQNPTLEGPSPPITITWTFRASNYIRSSPVIDPDGNVYFGSHDGNLYSINPNGVLKWKYPTGYEVTSTPALSQYTIYFGGGPPTTPTLYALTYTGLERWRCELEGTNGFPAYLSPTVAPDGTVYVGSSDNKLYAITPSGNIKWVHQLDGAGGENILSSPAIGSDGTIYIVYFPNGQLFAVNPDGSRKWVSSSYQLSSHPTISTTGTGDVIYVGSNDSRLYAFNQNGGLRWTNPAEFGQGPVKGAPALDSAGLIYLGTSGNNGSIWRIQDNGVNTTPTRTEIFSFSNLSVESSILIDNSDYLYFGTSASLQPMFFCINKEGNERWRITLREGVSSSAALSPDGAILYFGCDDYKLYALTTSQQPPNQYLQDSPWPMFRKDIYHTGRSSYPGPTTNQESFTPPIFSEMLSKASPVIDHRGYIILGTDSGNLYWFHPNGSIDREFNLSGFQIQSTPVLGNNGYVYFGAHTTSVLREGFLFAVIDGNEKWRVSLGTGYNIIASAVITGGALAYGWPRLYIPTAAINFLNVPNYLYAVQQTSENTAIIRWSYPLEGRVLSSPVLGKDGTIYVGTENGNIYAIKDYDTITGTKWGPVNYGGGYIASPAVAEVDGVGEILYFASTTGTIYALYTNDGTIWKQVTPSGNPSPTAFESSPAIGQDGTVYIGNNNGVFYAFNKDLTLKWRFPKAPRSLSSPIKSSPAIAYDPTDNKPLIYFGCNNGKIYCLKDKGTTWEKIFEYEMQNYQFEHSSPAISANRVLYICATNYVQSKGAFIGIGRDPAELRLTKKANKQRVAIGEIITYKITIRNVAPGPDPADRASNVILFDKIPPGFKYVKGSSVLVDNAGNIINRNDPTGFDTPTLSYALPDIKAGETIVLSYQLVVGSGVAFGKYQNEAYLRYFDMTQTKTTEPVKETILVIPDPLFDLGTIIGKVFQDTNGNGFQDEGEVGIANAKIIMENGTIVTTDKDGKYHIPGITPGVHLLRLQVKDFTSSQLIRVTEGLLAKANFPVSSSPSEPKKSEDREVTVVLLGEAEIGYSTIKKESNADLSQLEKNDQRYTQGWYRKEGIAGYVQARPGNYQITASIDTKRERNRDLYRYIDPDKYYPSYGDESSISWEATNTQGSLYLNIIHLPSNSEFLLGNYQTGLNQPGLATYNRTLYGGKINIEYKTKASLDNKPAILRTMFFAAQARQLAAHNEIRATGGSIYYLKHRNLIEGSEQVRIEVRDKVTYLTLQSIPKSRVTDYEIDYSNGRIIFKQAIGSVVTSDSIISSHILNGNPVYIIVDYEYQPEEFHFEEGIYGGRVTHQISGLTIGATAVSEQEGNKDYDLMAFDLSIERLPGKTKIMGEYAQSETQGIPNYVSLDGGLSFTSIINQPISKGSAYTIKTESRLTDKLNFTGYYQRLQPGFVSQSIVAHQGTEKYGFVITLKQQKNSEDRTFRDFTLSTSLRYDVQEVLRDRNPVSRALVGAKKTETTGLQSTYQKNKLTLTAELRHQKVVEEFYNITSEINQDTTLGAIRADYAVTHKFKVFCGQQLTLRGPANNQTTLGGSYQITQNLSGHIQVTSGSLGTSGLLGVTNILPISDKTQLSTSFNYEIQNQSSTSLPQRTFTTEAGVSSQVTPTTRLYAQQQFQTSSKTFYRAQTIGQETQKNNWLVKTALEIGLVNNFDGSKTERKAGSFMLSYNDPNQLRLSTKLEARFDKGEDTASGKLAKDRLHYGSANDFFYKLTADLSFLGRFNWSMTDDQTSNITEAFFKETTVGLVLRPVKWDKLNLIGKYTILIDQHPRERFASVVDPLDITKERAKVYAIEMVYELFPRFQIIEKYALKQGEEKVGPRDWTNNSKKLWITRFNYEFLKKWWIGTEYRWLNIELANDYKQGALLEVIYKLNQDISVGVGYNFTDFTDDLVREADYSVKGPFIRVLATVVR